MAASENLTPELLEILACPNCHAALTLLEAAQPASEQPALACTSDACGLVYPVRDGIPILLIDEARRPSGGAG